MVEFKTEVIDVIERTPSVKSFRFKVEKGIIWKPGQYLFLTIKVNGQDVTKPLSFSNSPTEKDYIECTKRITASPFSQALNAFKAGGIASIRMPYGVFTFEGELPKIAFISGGVGITPVRSICKYLTDIRSDSNAILLYSNSVENEIVFRDDFDEMAKINNNFKVVYTLTGCADDNNLWCGNRGVINADMIKKEAPDYSDWTFFISGPPGMVTSMVDVLRVELAIEESRIKLEKFAGY